MDLQGAVAGTRAEVTEGDSRGRWRRYAWGQAYVVLTSASVLGG